MWYDLWFPDLRKKQKQLAVANPITPYYQSVHPSCSFSDDPIQGNHQSTTTQPHRTRSRIRNPKRPGGDSKRNQKRRADQEEYKRQLYQAKTQIAESERQCDRLSHHQQNRPITVPNQQATTFSRDSQTPPCSRPPRNSPSPTEDDLGYSRDDSAAWVLETRPIS